MIIHFLKKILKDIEKLPDKIKWFSDKYKSFVEIKKDDKGIRNKRMFRNWK